MTIAAETEKRIRKVTTKLEGQLGLAGFLQIKHHFVEGYDGDTTAPGPEGVGSVHKTCAVTTALWQYRSVKITWYCGTCANQTDEELVQIALHEYVHALMAPVTSFLFDYLSEDESSTEQIRILGHHGKLEEFATESLMRVIGHAMGLSNVN